MAAPETAPTLAEEAPLSEGDAVAVTMHVTGDPDDVVRHLAAHEISPANVSADFIEAYVPLLDLPDLVARDDIVRIEFIHPPRGVGARMRAGLRASNRRARHLPMRYETGLPSSVIRFRTLHASTASRRCPDELRGPKTVADDRRVPEERILHARLLMVPRRLLPPSPSERLHPPDRPIAGT